MFSCFVATCGRELRCFLVGISGEMPILPDESLSIGHDHAPLDESRARHVPWQE